MFKRLLLSCALFAFCSVSSAQEAEADWIEYDLSTKNTIGLNAKVMYPSDFEPRASSNDESLSVDFLKYFDNKDAVYLGVISTKAEIGDEIDNVREEDMRIVADRFVKSGGFKISGLKFYKYKGLPAIIFDAELSNKVSGDKRYSKDTRVIVLTKEHAVNLYCGVSGLAKSKKTTVDTHNVLKNSFCTQYFDTLEID